jgi:hypothetical protein
MVSSEKNWRENVGFLGKKGVRRRQACHGTDIFPAVNKIFSPFNDIVVNRQLIMLL